MRSSICLLAILGMGLAVQPNHAVLAQQGASASWIWFNEGDPAKSAPAGVRYFRKTFGIDRPFQKPVEEGTLDITADNAFTVWVNGAEVGKGSDWKKVYRFDVMKHLVHGKNVIAVKAENEGSAAGLLVRLAYVPSGQNRMSQFSDGTWKASKTAAEGWQKVEFNDATWEAAKVVAAYGQGPWKGMVWEGGGDDRFAVPPGFVVEMVVPPRPASIFAEQPPAAGNRPRTGARRPAPGQFPAGHNHLSLVNMCFDAKGRLLISQERGPILLCTDPDSKGVFQNIRPYCDQVINCQGMCWVKDTLLLVGDGHLGSSPSPPGGRGRGEGGQTITGLWRCKDTDGDDKIDTMELLHRFKGGMGEHGPHAIIYGPDDWLYLVIGNHAWAQPEKLAANSPLYRWPTGTFGPDQGNVNTTEDVLLPRLNDSRGHAANILAPGGTIWRLDHEGKNMSLVNCGFRNHFDAAFSPTGELFTFDSDMEWDVGLPWYRAVRICHCPPGADYVWRTGAANTPDYYIDSLAPMIETGRGSPVGVEFYDHEAFPAPYRGAYFLADWAIGVIYAVILERDGATFKGTPIKFCVGAPMAVTDLAVGPDGALYFTMGGRGTEGAVYRIVYKDKLPPAQPKLTQSTVEDAVRMPQPLAAYSRAKLDEIRKKTILEWPVFLRTVATTQQIPTVYRTKALDLLQNYGPKPDAKLLISLVGKAEEEGNPFVAGHAVYLLGVNAYPEGKLAIFDAMKDGQASTRRRACEAAIRAGFEPPVDAFWHLFSDEDRFVRTAARLLLERIDPKKWADKLFQEKHEHVVLEGIIALCKSNHAEEYAERIFSRLHDDAPRDDPQAILDYLRTLQMALIHTTSRPGSIRGIAVDCLEMFPHADWRVNRELAILLSHFRREKILDEPVHAKLLSQLVGPASVPAGGDAGATGPRQQQIHYFYCLRFLHEGWTPEQKNQLLAWYEGTKSWEGGHSFTPFLENILRDLNPIFTAEDRNRAIAGAPERPWTATAMLRFTPENQLLDPQPLGKLYLDLVRAKPGSNPRNNELKESIINAIGRNTSENAQDVLRKIADEDRSQRDNVARNLARSPSAENWPYLVNGLFSTSPLVINDCLQALAKIDVKPKLPKETPGANAPGSPAEAQPFRAVLLASTRLEPAGKQKAVALLQQWQNKRFSPEEGDWKTELAGWSRWYAQTFPKAEPLPNLAAISGQSKWKFDELLNYLTQDAKGRAGDAARGKAVFTKAQCIKCHKFGNEGEGLGPDLTTLKSRFKRADTLEAILYPSKVISDQYRGSVILLKSGKTLTGLAAPQGDTVTILQLDGSKVTIKVSEIDTQVASTTSPMPEKLLDELTLQEIADLFAYLEGEPGK
jgi:putative heme-binding domain-containing protein